MLFVLFNNDKVIGCFDNKQALDLMISGLKINKFCKNLKFTCYHNNSICSTEYEEEVINEEEPEPKKELSEKDIEKQKKIEYNLNVLKQKKERIEESKRTFKVDLDLYEKFKKFKENNESFEIPELFQNKWDLMLQLEKENNLNFDNFFKLYKNVQPLTEYGKYFAGEVNAKDRELVDIDTEPETTDNEDN